MKQDFGQNRHQNSAHQQNADDRRNSENPNRFEIDQSVVKRLGSTKKSSHSHDEKRISRCRFFVVTKEVSQNRNGENGAAATGQSHHETNEQSADVSDDLNPAHTSSICIESSSQRISFSSICAMIFSNS